MELPKPIKRRVTQTKSGRKLTQTENNPYSIGRTVDSCTMHRMTKLLTLFTGIIAFFFGSFLTTMLISVEQCPKGLSGIARLPPHPEIFLVVLVLSAPYNTARRQAMRETWLPLGQPLELSYYPEEHVYLPFYDDYGHLEVESVADQAQRLRAYTEWMTSEQGRGTGPRRNIKVRHFFAVGTAGLEPGHRLELQREHVRYGDMLLLPHHRDAYDALTDKLLHANDALTELYEFSYLLKVDDDTYVRLDALLNELVSYDRKLVRRAAVAYINKPLPQLYWGYFTGRASIASQGPWRERHYRLAPRYIPYALGGGYILSRKLCDFIADNEALLSRYISEDVSVGTWLAPLRNVYRRHDPRFDTVYMPRKCRRHHLVLHKRNETLMRDLHAGRFCTFELSNEALVKRPPEYYYDWSAVSMKCCEQLVKDSP